MKITIYGSSDDLIEIEGDIREEFNSPQWNRDQGPVLLAVSDGTLLQISYGDNNQGIWRIQLLWRGSAKFEKREATHQDRDYSDRVTLEGDDIHWVVLGDQKVIQ